MCSEKLMEPMMEFLKSNWELGVLLLFVFFHTGANIEAQRKRDKTLKQCKDDNTFAADSLIKASTAGITAVSLLISATFVIVQLSNQNGRTLDPHIKPDVFHGTLCFLASMFLGLFVIFVVPGRGRSKNVSQSLLTILPFGYQLISLLTGVLYLVSAFHKLMFS